MFAGQEAAGLSAGPRGGAGRSSPGGREPVGTLRCSVGSQAFRLRTSLSMPRSRRSRSAARTGRAAPADPMPVEPAVPSEEEAAARTLLEALRAVARELRLTEQRERPQLGIPPAQLRVLRELAVRPAGSLGELAARTYTDPSSASVVVQRLVERGLVVRVESETDRRRTTIAATPEGQALAAQAPADAVARVADAITPLGEDQAAALSQGLRALARQLRAAHPGAGGAADA